MEAFSLVVGQRRMGRLMDALLEAKRWATRHSTLQRGQSLTVLCADWFISSPMSAADWFRDTPWSQVPPHMEGDLVRAEAERPRPKLLGGSSKLAKLAEERRKRAAAGPISAANGAPSALDRLGKSRDVKENEQPAMSPEPKKYPIRKKKDPTPPPREPTPPPAEVEEERPDLRASPTEFGRTLSTSPAESLTATSMTLEDMFGRAIEDDPFKGPSPDDHVRYAQQHSKGMGK